MHRTGSPGVLPPKESLFAKTNSLFIELNSLLRLLGNFGLLGYSRQMAA
jgi:hypothetical protein